MCSKVIAIERPIFISNGPGDHPKILMIKNLLVGILGLIVGLAIGFFAANSVSRNAISKTPVSLAVNAVPGGQAPQGGMQPEVAKALDEAKNQPESFEAQLKAGGMYAQIGNFDKAKEYFDKAAPLAPNTFAGNVTIANAYFDAKQFELAQKYYEKALAINPNDVDARTDLGSTYIERVNPDFDRGIATFNESLKINPKHEPTLFNLAIAYFRKGDTENAKKAVAQLEQANPSSPLIAPLKQRLNSN